MRTKEEIREMLETIKEHIANTEDMLIKAHLESEKRLLEWVLSESEE